MYRKGNTYMISQAQAKLFCKDDISLIENYDIAVNDKTNKWVVHHRRGTIYSRKGLKDIGQYYKRPAIELIFMLKEEHDRLHHIGENNPFFGKHHSKKTKEKMSEAMSGENHPNYGKHLSEKTKKKMSRAKMGNHYKPTKPILQYTKDGKFIKEWMGSREVERVLEINQSHITQCCKGNRKSSGGFIWRYAED